jgi:hypothetical protein
MTDESNGPQDTPKTSGSMKKPPNWLGRQLWMGPSVAEAREKTFAPGKPGFAWFDLARQLGDDVVETTGKSSLALVLLDSAQVGLLVRAHLEREGALPGGGPLGDADWANALRIPVVGRAFAKLTAAQASTLTALLGPGRDAALAKLTGEERELFASAVHGLAIGICEPLEYEARRLWSALFARWLRLTVVVLLLAVLFAAVGTWLVKKCGKPNLALHRPVTVSSQFPPQGTDHRLLVDGDHDNLGFHTQSDGQQWVVIDLGSVRKFDRVVVYNRSDCCQDRAVPLRLEVSKDNENFTFLREWREISDKWTAKGLRAEGRYVRLLNTPPNFFHLAEVEVY